MLPAAGEDLKRKTEEELLASDNLTEEERRRIKRRASNRESARRTRFKRTEKLKELEEKKLLIGEENAKIINQIHELEKIYWDAIVENRQLKSEIQIIRTAKPQLNALCPPTMSTAFSATPPMPTDFLSMTLPHHGTVPPALPLSLTSEIPGMPHPQAHAPMPDFSGMTALGSSMPAALLSIPPPLTTTLHGGLPPAPNGASRAPAPDVRSINFTSMLEGVDTEGVVPPTSVQAALAQFYVAPGMPQPQPMLPPVSGKDGGLLGEGGAAPMLPDVAAFGAPFMPQALPPSLPMPAPDGVPPPPLKDELDHTHSLPPS